MKKRIMRTVYGWMLVDKDTKEIIGQGVIYWWYDNAKEAKEKYSSDYLIRIVKVKISQV